MIKFLYKKTKRKNVNAIIDAILAAARRTIIPARFKFFHNVLDSLGY
jgi:hypothetical protein